MKRTLVALAVALTLGAMTDGADARPGRMGSYGGGPAQWSVAGPGGGPGCAFYGRAFEGRRLALHARWSGSDPAGFGERLRRRDGSGDPPGDRRRARDGSGPNAGRGPGAGNGPNAGSGPGTGGGPRFVDADGDGVCDLRQ